MSNDIAANRSTLKEFLASIATISGDLSNITAPPFVLADNSTVELPQYWADHPHLFTAPVREESAEKRALLVLKNFLGSLRNQQYAGRKEEDGVKKPLNAFLGELFMGSWYDEEIGETKILSEQVAHHPPVTACYLYNDKLGIRAEGFTQQEITFSGNVSIKQKGYAILHVDKYDEDYLIPVPTIKVKGLLSGVPYPEATGEYSLISSNGYVSHIKFEGKSFFGSGQKNGFQAKLFHSDNPDEILYTVQGAWNGKSTVKDARTNTELETLDVLALKGPPLRVPELSEQDPWESRRAWGDVIAALRQGDMKGTTTSKSKVEQGQRRMRKDEQAKGEQWKTVFFDHHDQDPVFESLVKHDPTSFTVDRAGGFWKINRGAVETAQKPYHGELLPTNGRMVNGVLEEDDQDSQVSSRSSSEASVGVAASQQKRGSWRSSISLPWRRSSDEETSPRQSTVGSTLEEARPSVDEKASRQSRVDSSQEKRRSLSGGASNTTNSHSGNVAVQEPTHEQVEAFLRAKASNVH